MPIRAVIFDFNGVLVDDEHFHFELFRDMLAALGVPLDEADYRDRYLGFDDRGAFAAALLDAGREAAPASVEELIALKAEMYANAAEWGVKLFPEAAETLASLADRYPVAICSGALRPEIESALLRLKVRDRVQSITSAEDTERCKPDPEGYLIALDRLGADLPDLEAGQCLVIEDSLAGIQAARAAGMVAVGVTHTYRRDELEGAGASAVVEELARITPAWIGALGDPV
jgi:beta-phosphoglucomutase